jgi:hypothetical protein
METDSSTKLAIIVMSVMALGTGRVNPADFFIENAHITSSNPAATRKIHATVEALLLGAGPSQTLFSVSERSFSHSPG